MTVALRPMSLGEILDRTFQIYRSRFWAFVGISVLVPLAHFSLALLAKGVGVVVDQTTLSYSIKSFLNHLWNERTTAWISGVVLCAIGPTMAYVASREFLDEISSIRSALYQCARRWESWLFYSLIVWAIQDGIPATINALMSGGLGWSRARGTFLFTAVNWLVQFALSAAVSLSAPVWIMERSNAPLSILRGLRMARSSYGRLFAAWCLGTALLWVLGASVSALMWNLVHIGGLSTAYRLLVFVPAYLSTVVALPIYPIAITLIYYDQRIRNEGYDIERLMDAAGMTALATPVAATAGDAKPMSAGAEVKPG